MAYIVFTFVAICVLKSVNAAECKSSTVGREFVFGILDTIGNCCHDKRNLVSLDITNASPNNTHVRLQIPFFSNDTNFNIPVGGIRTIMVNPNIQSHGTFVLKRGIKISSDNDITVLVSNAYPGQASIDSYNIIPTSNLGSRFILSSHGSKSRGRGGLVMVSGFSNNINVTLMNGNSVVRSVVINLFEVFQYACGTCDLSGARVISDKDVFVVSGTAFTQIPASSNEDEYIASEMFPVSSWSRKYIVSPVFPKSSFMLKMISKDTFLNAKVSNITRSYILTKSLTEQYFGSEPVVVSANHRFSLTQYGVGYDYDQKAGDPFMAVIPGIDQYINDYKFSVPQGYYGVKSYVAIVVPKMYQDGLMLDKLSIHLYNGIGPLKRLEVPAPFDNYTILIFRIQKGYHHFVHQSTFVKFGVFVYGLGYYSGHGLSYGFYAGFDLKNDCSMTSLPKTYLPTTIRSSTRSSGKGPMCYSCQDLSHVGLCDTVHQCGVQEVCYVERYVESGQVKYITGCLEENTCPLKRSYSTYSDARCVECCHDDYCNNKGCGENGIPDRDSRGPICLDCQHVASPEECVHITPCDSHQGCSIEEYKWFGNSHFKMGCGHVSCHPVRRRDSHVVKRATPVCQSCCTEDYCNRNCTTSSQGQLYPDIIG